MQIIKICNIKYLLTLPTQMLGKEQANETKPYPYYTLQRRAMVVDSRLFKIQNYDEENILFSACESRCIVKTDNQLKNVVKIYECDGSPSALDVIRLGQHKFIVVGFHKGHIVVRKAENGENSQLKQNQDADIQQWKFKPNSGESIINDIAHHPQLPSIFVSCYNNGSIAVWGLIKSQRLHTFLKVHQKYTYKIRFQCPNIMVSCGADCSVVRTDLQKQQYLSTFNHSYPVWCAYPINTNQIASVGLFCRVLIWDVRANRVVQYCNNSGNQSSFITKRLQSQNELYYGDSTALLKWDRRKAKPELLSKHNMQVSSQGMLFKNDYLYSCGRGKDLCFLKGSDTLQKLSNGQISKRTSKLKVNSKSKQRQIQQDDQNEQQMSDQDEDDQNMSQQSIIDQTQPLIKSSKQYKFNKPIKLVAEIKIQEYTKLKQHEQAWFKNPHFSDDEQQQSDDQIDRDIIISSRKKKIPGQ